MTPMTPLNSITRAFLIEEATIVKRVLKGKMTAGGKK
jgi:predicted RNA polymerase sigma factor